MSNSLFLLLLYFTINHARSLSIPLNISMHSVNMKHILKWSPLQVSCSTFNYTVQFQGEYELYKLNGTWVNAFDCQEISENKCDLTHDLASNSDYNVRIQTNCDAILLAPKMTVNVESDPIHVGLSTTLSDMTINLKAWKEGDEQNAKIHVIGTYPYQFSIAAHRGEEKMCFRADILVESINKRCSTDIQCVIIPKLTSDFVKPVLVSISVVIMVAVATILGWLARCFGPQIKHTICQREPVPNALLNDWPTSTPILCTVSLESTDPLLLLLPAEHHCTTVQVEGT